jgi:hypothetical protein
MVSRKAILGQLAWRGREEQQSNTTPTGWPGPAEFGHSCYSDGAAHRFTRTSTCLNHGLSLPDDSGRIENRTMNTSHARLLRWWTDDPADPGRLTLDDPDVQRLITAISPGSRATDPGGVMSLNVRLDAAGLVLRVHQPFVSRQRLLALQDMRRLLAHRGMRVARPIQSVLFGRSGVDG